MPSRVVNDLLCFELGEYIRDNGSRCDHKLGELFVCESNVDQVPMATVSTRKADEIIKGGRNPLSHG